MKQIWLCSVLLLSFLGNAQEKDSLKIKVSGFLETYYAYDFTNPTTETKLPFMYNYNRHNEFNVNNGLIRTQLQYGNTYASIAVHAGTYVDDNYASEDIKLLSEAYVGLYLNDTKKASIEVGIMPSYIGFESATTASNLTLTRSILAENSPYFMTGVKYNYKPNDKWSFSGLVTNGWQRINKPQKDVAPALGTQIVFKPSEKSTLNWSTFIGKEFYGTELAMRYFNNLYWDNTWNSKWRTILGFDFGIQDSSSLNDKHLFWMSPVLIAQYSINTKWQTAFRFEYYQDENNVIVATSNAFKTSGASINLDYLPNSKVKLRTEARYLDSKEAIFFDNKSNNFFVTTSLSFEF
ncbi:porin [Flavobacterium cucumis]|uniref:Putative beta-barrel porin-2, OmpL-like. bbp2 n=1 Tax=Flavobacterium cucumis TaxID=416016 RepID=A0A1M7ZVT1_9FLAO|nr:porin [Flavobacterium cucumis]SHO72978.1 Putative beta-barrel porin-2, OmpL-like. bbp2 [Flavobacterium cucumis]